MRDQRQTIFGDKVGNCFSTCVASMLDLDTSEVPNFCADPSEGWFDRFDKWLQGRGFRAFDIRGCSEFSCGVGAPFIASGPSPRGDFQHCVIAQWDGKDFKVLMDPHPDNTGLAGPFTAMTFLNKS